MNNKDDDIKELEMEQLEFIKRNSDQMFIVPDDSVQYPDALKQPLERPIVLDKEMEEKLTNKIREEVVRNIPSQRKVKEGKPGFSLNRYFDIVSTSFMGIMDDILNFDGDVEEIPQIFTKDDRMVLIGTIVMLISIFLLVSRK